MNLIPSFEIDHMKLQPGLYVSRKDAKDGCVVTTFDIRITRPNFEPPVDMPAVHTIEHLGATWLRDRDEDGDIVYFGPMGCRTGFYLVMFGDLSSEDVLPLVQGMCAFILEFEGEIPGAKPDQCGNYSEQNLNMAKYYIRKYLDDLTENRRLEYPAGGAR